MKNRKLHMIGNAHIDPVWLWRWQEGYHEVRATFRSALDRMKEFNDFIFVSSSAAFYEWIEESDPKMFAEIQQRVAEGRWGVVGGWWVEPDCNIPAAESFVRHSLYAQRYFRSRFGVMARTGFNVDSFGHSAIIPQILKKSNIDHYVFLRPMPYEKYLPSHTFLWESADGSRTLTSRIAYEYLSWGADVDVHALRCAGEIREPVDEFMCYYGVGNHGGGPTIENIKSIHRLDADANFPASLVFSTPEQYFKGVLDKDCDLPVVRDELQGHAKGCYSVHSGIKRWNRKAENDLQAAEKWCSIAAWELGQEYPGDFTHAWKQLLFNQFHDILAGTSLEEAYLEVRDMIGETFAIAQRNFNKAVQNIAWNITIPWEQGSRPLVVFNPLTWDVDANIEIESQSWKPGAMLVDEVGKTIPHQSVQSSSVASRMRLSFNAQLPALGYRTYRLLENGSPQRMDPDFPSVQATDLVLDNGRFRLEFDAQSGQISSLRDIHLSTEVFAGMAAQAVVLDDPSDTWGHNMFVWDRVVGEFTATSIKLVEHGPVKSVIRVASTYGASSLTQDFTMYPNLDEIDVLVCVDWHETYKMLKLRFPVNVHFMKVTRDLSYGHIESLANGEELPFQQWVDVSGISREKEIGYGFALMNDGKYSVDVRVRDIGLTVLRSPAYAHHDPAKLDPERLYSYIDQGQQTFRYRMLPHRGSWETSGVIRKAYEINQTPYVMFSTFHQEGSRPQKDSFIHVEPENIMVTVIKQAEDSEDLIIRAVEMHHLRTSSTITLPHSKRTITAQFAPGEIKTFRVPKDQNKDTVEVNLLEDA